MASTKSRPLRRTEADEKEDLEDALKNYSGAAYADWPNEAGFDGLTEERGPINIPITGNIPAWAAGSLYRTGPGVYKVEDTVSGTFYTSHWFDGLAHTHRFEIMSDENGTVQMTYSSRRQGDDMVEHIKKHGSRTHYSFGQRSDPCLGLFSKVMSTWRATQSKPEERWIENISVAVHPNFPGLDAVEGNLIGKREGSKEGATSTGDEKGPVSSGGHRAKLPRTVWLSTDNSMLKQIDPQTLEPIGFATQKALHPALLGHLSCAHAQHDPITGDVFNFNLEFGRTATYRVFQVSASTGKTSILATIRRPDLRAAYIHSLYLSPSYVILCVPSSHIAMNGMRILWERNVLDSIEPFDTSKKCKWFVVDRLHGKGVVAEFDTDAGFFFHTVNAFEERDETDLVDGTNSLFCEVIEFPTLEVMYSMYYDVILQKDGAEKEFWGNEQRRRDVMMNMAQYRFRVPLAATEGETTASRAPNKLSTAAKILTIPAPHAGELPTINPLFTTRRHRYVYSVCYRGRSTIMDGIVKTDTLTKDVLFWDNPTGHSPGEAIFIPRPGGTEEDDGALLSVVLDGHNRTSYLLCLDAKTMTELGRGEVGFAVGFGFHGTHVGNS
ncbi:carotenoid oxygenase [Bombardia bombarda]|uniref:Carotenoid oxygenase n=1 Tax=Bombardia bombarda TaxID=252184 RepID=A0AA40BVI5_9PEZI|nr:carotenoid oxygenase [Bombardia bombarda]